MRTKTGTPLPAGGEPLARAALAIVERCRAGGRFSRYGNEDFLTEPPCPRLKGAAADRTHERLRLAIRVADRGPPLGWRSVPGPPRWDQARSGLARRS